MANTPQIPGKNPATEAFSEVLAQVVPHPALDVLRSSSLSTLVQQEIEQMIMKGQLVGGDKLNEAMLAERLGISRGPVREAFRMLEEAGLLRQEKNRGVFVREIPVDEAIEILDLRAVMDQLAGQSLAQHATAAQLAALAALVDAMEHAVTAQDSDAFHALNLEFHDQLIELAGNRKLAVIYRKMGRELALFRRRSLPPETALSASAAEHRDILKAIGSRDVALAGATMYEHVMRSKQRMLEGMGSAAATALASPLA